MVRMLLLTGTICTGFAWGATHDFNPWGIACIICTILFLAVVIKSWRGGGGYSSNDGGEFWDFGDAGGGGGDGGGGD